MRLYISPDKINQHQVYGFTHGQLQEIRLRQVDGVVEIIDANNAQNFQDPFFEVYRNYKIPKHDAMHYHIAMEARTFDPLTGVKVSSPRVVCIDTTTFRQMIESKPFSGFHGFATCILHNPEKQA